jgi:hypothetical protein
LFFSRQSSLQMKINWNMKTMKKINEIRNKRTRNKRTRNKRTRNKRTRNKWTRNKRTWNKRTRNKRTKNKQTKNQRTPKIANLSTISTSREWFGFWWWRRIKIYLCCRKFRYFISPNNSKFIWWKKVRRVFIFWTNF